MRPSITTVLLPLLAVFIVVVAAGSMRRKGTLSSGAYYGVLTLTVAVAAGTMITWWLHRPS